jgi:hypothetical protein
LDAFAARSQVGQEVVEGGEELASVIGETHLPAALPHGDDAVLDLRDRAVGVLDRGLEGEDDRSALPLRDADDVIDVLEPCDEPDEPAMRPNHIHEIVNPGAELVSPVMVLRQRADLSARLRHLLDGDEQALSAGDLHGIVDRLKRARAGDPFDLRRDLCLSVRCRARTAWPPIFTTLPLGTIETTRSASLP